MFKYSYNKLWIDVENVGKKIKVKNVEKQEKRLETRQKMFTSAQCKIM